MRKRPIQTSLIESFSDSCEGWSVIEETAEIIASEFSEGGIRAIVALRMAAELIQSGRSSRKKVAQS